MYTKAAFVGLLAGAAQAFVPSPSSNAPSTQLMAKSSRSSMAEVSSNDEARSIALPFATKPDNLNGELVGDVGFDPFGFTEKGDLAKFRRAELKHGRVSMLAVVGAIAQEYYSVQGPDFTPTKNVYSAITQAPPLAILQLLVFIGAYDVTTTRWEKANGRVPGDIGFDPLRLSADGINEQWALSELKHGRLAMFAAAAILAQQLVSPDKSILEQTFEWARSFG